MATFVAGNPLTAAQLNAVQGTWTAYTPTLTGVTKGNGTLVAEFLQTTTAGSVTTVSFFIQFTLGSTSAITGGVNMTLPATAAQANWGCDAVIFDNSASVPFPAAGIALTTTAVFLRTWPTTAGNNLIAVGATVPMTWATGDVITFSGEYKAA